MMWLQPGDMVVDVLDEYPSQLTVSVVLSTTPPGPWSAGTTLAHAAGHKIGVHPPIDHEVTVMWLDGKVESCSTKHAVLRPSDRVVRGSQVLEGSLFF